MTFFVSTPDMVVPHEVQWATYGRAFVPCRFFEQRVMPMECDLNFEIFIRQEPGEFTGQRYGILLYHTPFGTSVHCTSLAANLSMVSKSFKSIPARAAISLYHFASG